MKIFLSLLAVLVLAGAAQAQSHTNHIDIQSRGFVCARNGNYLDLVNLRSRQAIWRFTFSSQCEKAREQARTGYMCVPNGNAVSLIFRNGDVIDNFTFSTQCEHARRDILNNL